MNILVAEDNQLNQQLFSAFIRRIGWTYTVVANGLQAVESCRKYDFDAILMDIDMPVLDGIEATRFIRKFNTEIPIIAITAYDEEHIRNESYNAGMNDFLAKPCSKEDILITVTRCTENRAWVA